MTLNIRKATLEDIPTLLEFEQGVIKAERPMNPTIQDGHINYYNLKSLITGDNSVLLVAELEGELVASGYAKILPDRHYLKHQYQGYLGFMFVPEEHRGNGYNKKIIDTLIAWCKEQDVYEIRLDVYPANESAIKAYEKAGFQKYMLAMRLDSRELKD
ncbi:GNAT family N-acetyltransferase [Gaetbulibacter aestuarii]|uniref:GNAT family N-acetyltransferase n=1 Tax=Gaetbulibacter aestuarii TaxID=1502358 RepID=A0ABW7MWY8_9FLAO